MSNNSSCGSLLDYQNKPLGILYIIHGLFYHPFYIPCLLAIFTKPLITVSCYQIMAPMAVLDLINLTYSALVSGYWSIIGFSYCTNYWLMKIICAIINGICFIGCWMTYYALCVTLAINRVLEVGSSAKVEQWFSNGKTLYWIAGCFFYGSCYTALYLTPRATLVYESKIGVGMYVPIDDNSLAIAVDNINNIGVLILLIILYSVIGRRVHQISGTIEGGDVTAEQLSIMKTKRTITLQCFCVCVLAGLTCLFYSTAPLLTNKVWVFQMTNLFWQVTQGANGIIYLCLNKTIRQRVKEIFTFNAGSPTPVPAAPRNVIRNNAVLEESL